MLVAASRFIERRDHEPSELKSQVQRSRNLVVATSMNALNVESLQALAIVAFSDLAIKPLAQRFTNPDRLATESVTKPGLSLVRSPDQFNTCSSVMRMKTGKGVHHLSALRHILRGREIGSKRKSDAGCFGIYLSWTGRFTVRRVHKLSRANSSPLKQVLFNDYRARTIVPATSRISIC
ncbi:fungal specific transcription factor [Colletotrichum asianum]